MTQLTINQTPYPETSSDRYHCYYEELSKDLRMISGRLVSEVRGRYRVITYQYDALGDRLMRTLLQDLRSRQPLSVTYLAPEQDEMMTGRFRCTAFPKPTIAFSDGGRPRWHNISFTLEEVDPHA